jgi:hypothetical protein
VTSDVDLATLVPRIKTLEAERADVAGRIAQASAEIVTLHPAAIEQYAADVARLADLTAAHAELPESAELVAMLRRLVAEVVVYAEPNARDFTIEVKGRLAELTGSAAFPTRSRG